jgi:hypothetical protein
VKGEIYVEKWRRKVRGGKPAGAALKIKGRIKEKKRDPRRDRAAAHREPTWAAAKNMK